MVNLPISKNADGFVLNIRMKLMIISRVRESYGSIANLRKICFMMGKASGNHRPMESRFCTKK